MLASVVRIEANQTPTRSDISGGAALIFNRPENPTPRDRAEATAKTQRSARDETSDKVEDAIALGNAARDRQPPDFESAEKAYRLAWKLNPRDPRPYVGLGNLYWDQRRYAEAAKAYRDALRFMDLSKKRALWAAILGGIAAGISDAEIRYFRSVAQTRIYLAASLLQERDPLGAEKELRLAAVIHSDNAEWNGLYGCALSAQNRYTEAAEAFERAVKLEPSNEKYKELLKDATQKAREASDNDQAITTSLQNTFWEIRDATSATIKGTCQLDASGFVRCKSGGPGLVLFRGTWKTRDAIFVAESALQVPFCIGRLREATIEVKCYSSDSETNEIWVKMKQQ